MSVARHIYTSKTLLQNIWSHAHVNIIKARSFQTWNHCHGHGHGHHLNSNNTRGPYEGLAIKYKTIASKCSHRKVSLILQRCVSGINSKIQFSLNNVNKNISENILVFSNENGSFYKFLTFFGVFQMLLWGYISLSPVQNLRPGPVSVGENTTTMPWWKKWLYKEGQYKNAITGIFLTVGTSILFVSLTYPRRAVKGLWLLKGGKHLKVITHSPFKSSQSFNVPLDNVNCLQARTGSGTQIPLKIKNKAFFFLIDKQGTFHHPEIFDFVIGLKRNL